MAMRKKKNHAVIKLAGELQHLAGSESTMLKLLPTVY